MEEKGTNSIFSELRKLSKLYNASANINPDEIRKGKALAARYYLSHNNREITLSNEQFQLVVDILKIKD